MPAPDPWFLRINGFARDTPWLHPIIAGFHLMVDFPKLANQPSGRVEVRDIGAVVRNVAGVGKVSEVLRLPESVALQEVMARVDPQLPREMVPFGLSENTLASCAFVLSFDALRSLAVTLGLPPSIAWLWPYAIDVAIGQATLCLLSLSRRATAFADAADAMATNDSEKCAAAPTGAQAPRGGDAAAARAGGAAAAVSARRDAARGRPASTADGHDAVAIRRWEPIAESIVRKGITSKSPRLVAAILTQREAGIPPSTIGRTHKVHHTTVGRIRSAAEALSA